MVHDNYEDPANHVPYESAEGGYQYYAGGPYHALEVVAEQFPDADQSAIEEAAEVIEAEGHEWVRRGQYP